MGGNQIMGVIFYPARGHQFEIVLPSDTAEISPYVGAELLDQQSLAVLGAEDAMAVAGNVGVWHLFIASQQDASPPLNLVPALKRWASSNAFLRNAFPSLRTCCLKQRACQV